MRHEFTTQDYVDTPPEVRLFAERAIGLVWDKFIGTSARFHIAYTGRFTDPATGELTNTTAEYNPDTDTIIFAMERVKEQFGDLELEAKMVIFAAHEATHKVQLERGEALIPSHLNDNYANDPHEDEAWKVALEVFKVIYPDSRGGFDYEGTHYELPEKSNW